MRDANEEALNKYMQEQEYSERMLENFIDDIEPLINEVSEIIERIKNIESGYESFDFTDEIKQQIGDLL
ncbi:MAG: hypothetical protein U9O83_01200 [Campylobacterota bacterium]|nr:hypothetical protein [Campylobacterota bacterium]